MLISLKQVQLRVPLQNDSAGSNTFGSSNKQRLLLKIPDFKVSPGSRILIQGPSGSGKSSLLHFIAGLFDASEGQLSWDEQLVQKLSDHQRSSIRREKFAIIFQRLNLLEHLSLRENVLLALSDKLGKNEKLKRSEQALTSVGLKSRANDLSAVLSLGEQQRLAIARALAQQPEVILADEPTSSLDQKNSELCMDALFEAAKNSSLIVVSHDDRIKKRFSNVKSILDWVP
jgi:putative ABC transport system ATP-binding protein